MFLFDCQNICGVDERARSRSKKGLSSSQYEILMAIRDGSRKHSFNGQTERKVFSLKKNRYVFKRTYSSKNSSCQSRQQDTSKQNHNFDSNPQVLKETLRNSHNQNSILGGKQKKKKSVTISQVAFQSSEDDEGEGLRTSFETLQVSNRETSKKGTMVGENGTLDAWKSMKSEAKQFAIKPNQNTEVSKQAADGKFNEGYFLHGMFEQKASDTTKNNEQKRGKLPSPQEESSIKSKEIEIPRLMSEGILKKNVNSKYQTVKPIPVSIRGIYTQRAPKNGLQATSNPQQECVSSKQADKYAQFHSHSPSMINLTPHEDHLNSHLNPVNDSMLKSLKSFKSRATFTGSHLNDLEIRSVESIKEDEELNADEDEYSEVLQRMSKVDTGLVGLDRSGLSSNPKSMFF